MGNELVVEELKKLQQKLKDTIHRLENNDDDGDGIIDKGRITPDEKKQIEAIEYEIKDFKEANKKWFERVTLKYKPSDDNIHKHSQDENTRNQKEQEKKDAINNNKKYSNTSASVQSKTTLETKINAESIGVALTRSLTASFSPRVFSSWLCR